MSRRSPPVVRAVWASALAVLALAGIASGADPQPPYGPGVEPSWARTIREEVAAQDADIARTGAKSVATRWANRAQRNNDLVTLYLLARAYGKAEQFRDAHDAYSDAIKAEPNCYLAWRDRGVLRLLQKPPDTRGGEDDLRRAVTLKPTYVEALRPLGALLIDQKRFDEGIRTLRRVLETEPADDPMRMMIVDAYEAWEKPRDALVALDPLLRSDPDNLGLLLYKGRLLLKAGDVPAATALARELSEGERYKRLRVRPEPHELLIGCLVKAEKIDPDVLLAAIERLRRLLDPKSERVRQLDELVRKIHEATAKQAPAAAGAPPIPPTRPTPEMIARQMRDPDGKARERALAYLAVAKKEEMTVGGDLLTALIERLGAKREPLPGNRLLALAVFGHAKDPRMAPIVRISLRDEDGRVRCKAADALEAMGSPLAVPALAVYATASPSAPGADQELGTAARAAILRLAARATPAAEPTPEAQTAAFVAWWQSEDAREVKLRAVDAVLSAAELEPQELLLTLALDEDPAVWPVAYRGLVQLRESARGSNHPKAQWMNTLPAFADADLVADRRTGAAEKLVAWWAGRPK